jgi:hypothetical protein
MKKLFKAGALALLTAKIALAQFNPTVIDETNVVENPAIVKVGGLEHIMYSCDDGKTYYLNPETKKKEIVMTFQGLDENNFAPTLRADTNSDLYGVITSGLLKLDGSQIFRTFYFWKTNKAPWKAGNFSSSGNSRPAFERDTNGINHFLYPNLAYSKNSTNTHYLYKSSPFFTNTLASGRIGWGTNDFKDAGLALTYSPTGAIAHAIVFNKLSNSTDYCNSSNWDSWKPLDTNAWISSVVTGIPRFKLYSTYDGAIASQSNDLYFAYKRGTNELLSSANHPCDIILRTPEEFRVITNNVRTIKWRPLTLSFVDGQPVVSWSQLKNQTNVAIATYLDEKVFEVDEGADTNLGWVVQDRDTILANIHSLYRYSPTPQITNFSIGEEVEIGGSYIRDKNLRVMARTSLEEQEQEVGLARKEEGYRFRTNGLNRSLFLRLAK